MPQSSRQSKVNFGRNYQLRHQQASRASVSLTSEDKEKPWCRQSHDEWKCCLSSLLPSQTPSLPGESRRLLLSLLHIPRIIQSRLVWYSCPGERVVSFPMARCCKDKLVDSCLVTKPHRTVTNSDLFGVLLFPLV